MEIVHPDPLLVPRWRYGAIAGATAWAAFGSVEAFFAVFMRWTFFRPTYIPPVPLFTLSLIVLYPLLGLIIGSVAGIAFPKYAEDAAIGSVAVAFVTNAFTILHGWSIVAPVLACVLVFLGAFLDLPALRNPW